MTDDRPLRDQVAEVLSQGCSCAGCRADAVLSLLADRLPVLLRQMGRGHLRNEDGGCTCGWKPADAHPTSTGIDYWGHLAPDLRRALGDTPPTEPPLTILNDGGAAWTR